MTLEARILLFIKLGKIIKEHIDSPENEEIFVRAKVKNPWFTLDNIKYALSSISDNYLNEKQIRNLIELEGITDSAAAKKIGLIAAGNIPLVCFQDVIHILLSGNKVCLKASSLDEVLPLWIFNLAREIDPEILEYWEFSEKLNTVDAYIATGSANSSRYFEYYFSKKPNIIRHNRSSVAILNGKETAAEIRELASEIFQYFGLGCRNISSIWVPENYDFRFFYDTIEYWNTIQMHTKYRNNYDYIKSIYLVNREEHLDNGFLLLKEDEALSSPISVLFYHKYRQISEIEDWLKKNESHLQTISSNCYQHSLSRPIGQAQVPLLEDYADGVNTMKFLLALQ
jgi:hypothetical protein